MESLYYVKVSLDTQQLNSITNKPKEKRNTDKSTNIIECLVSAATSFIWIRWGQLTLKLTVVNKNIHHRNPRRLTFFMDLYGFLFVSDMLSSVHRNRHHFISMNWAECVRHTNEPRQTHSSVILEITNT